MKKKLFAALAAALLLGSTAVSPVYAVNSQMSEEKESVGADQQEFLAPYKIEKPACLEWKDGEYYIVPWNAPETTGGDNLAFLENDYGLCDVYILMGGFGGEWAYYYLRDCPKVEERLPEWVEQNLPGWECEYGKGVPADGVTVDELDYISVHPVDKSQKVYTTEWLDVCEQIYEDLGYPIKDYLIVQRDNGTQVIPEKTYKKGDVNMDGVIGLEDAMLVLQEYTAVVVAHLPHDLTDEQLQLARVHPEIKRTLSSDEHLLDDAWTILMYYTASITDSAVLEQDIDSWIADYWGLDLKYE